VFLAPVPLLVAVAVLLTWLQTPEQQVHMPEDVVALHRAVFERLPGQDLIDTSLPRDLALRYLYGRGVEQDVVQGCALLYEAHAMAHAPRHDQPGIDIAEALINQHCKRFGAEQLIELKNLTGCGFIGLKRHVLPLQPGSWIEFSRLGVAIERPSGRVEHWFAGDPTCWRHVKMLRTVLLPGADTTTDEAYLIEMLSWQGVRYKGELRRELEWRLFSVGQTGLEVRVQEIVMFEPGSLWPPPALPERFHDGASLTRGPNGAIRWRFPGEPPLQGAIDYWKR
jgi:hypothetical protein